MKVSYVLADFKYPDRAMLIDRFTEEGVSEFSSFYVQSTKVRDALNNLLGTRFKKVFVNEGSKKELESLVVQSGKEVFFSDGRFEWDGEDIYCWTPKCLVRMSNSEWASFSRLY